MSKKNNIQFWLLLILLIIVDTLGIAIINYSVKKKKKNNYYILGMILLGMTGYILYNLLNHGEVLLINALWDTIGFLLLTSIAAIVFKEKLSITKIIGIVLSIISLIFINYDSIKTYF